MGPPWGTWGPYLGIPSVEYFPNVFFWTSWTRWASPYHRISIREELSRRGSDWQYIFEMEHLPLLPTKPSLIEGRYPTVGHFEGKMFSSWACEPGCYSTKPVLKWITCPTADYLSSKMPNCQYSREVVDISFDQLEVEFYVQLTLYWVRGLPLICLWYL